MSRYFENSLVVELGNDGIVCSYEDIIKWAEDHNTTDSGELVWFTVPKTADDDGYSFNSYKVRVDTDILRSHRVDGTDGIILSMYKADGPDANTFMSIISVEPGEYLIIGFDESKNMPCFKAVSVEKAV